MLALLLLIFGQWKFNAGCWGWGRVADWRVLSWLAHNFFWASSSTHCLAILDLGAGVEQPFDCLIVQNHQARQSMRRLMAWTLETWSMVYSSAPHSQAAEEAIPHLYKQEQKHPTLVRRRLSRVGDENTEFCGVLCPLRIPLMIWVWVSAKWSRCPRSMARRARDSLAPLRQRLAGWVPARIGSLSTGVGRKHPVTICRASLMAGLIRQVWALWHQTGTQYSVVECTRARVAVHRVVAPAPQPEPASCLRSMTCDVSFLQSDSRCWQYVSDLPNVTPRYLGFEQRPGFRCWSWLSSHV